MDMSILTIDVASIASIKARMKTAALGEGDSSPRFTFTSGEDLLRTLNPNRWSLLKALAGSGPLGVRELSRRVKRDVKGVHTDANALIECGLIEKTDNGALLLPYDDVHVEFEARAEIEAA